MNIIDRSGPLAISTRLQRLSEQIRRDGQLIYQAAGIAFEPKWFPVIYVLHIKSPLSVVEIAGEIGYSHPSTISLLRELEKEKLVRSSKDKTDNRRRLIQLTPKALELITRMEPLWEKMTQATAALTNTPNNLFDALTEVEEALKQESFLSRTAKLI